MRTITQLPTVQTMSGFIIPGSTTGYLKFRDGRWYSPKIHELYIDIVNDNLDTSGSYKALSDLFKHNGMKYLIGSCSLIDELNKKNESAIIRKYTKDYEGMRSGLSYTEWSHMSFSSVVEMFIEDNKSGYNKMTSKDHVRLPVDTRYITLPKTQSRNAISNWFLSAGWRDFIRQLWLVYGDIRQQDPLYTQDVKVKPIKVKLG